MCAHAEAAYVQARLQARHAARPDDATWRAVEASRTCAHYLTLARAGALAPWVEGIDADADVHRVEAALRVRWHRHVDEVAGWQAPRWHAATRWFGLLPELPRWAAWPRAIGADAAAEPWAADVRAWLASHTGADDLAPRWRAEWQRRLPAEARGDAAVHRPAQWLLPALADLPAKARDGGLARAATEPLRDALRRLFRRHAMTAAAVYAHLALVWLDVERLRGGLVTRRLLDPPPASAA